MKNEISQSRKTSASTRSNFFPISVLIFIISIIIYRLSTIGPFAPLQCRLLGIGCSDTKIQGYVASEFIDVKKAFIKNFEDGSEVGSSVAVYYNGKLVVDLYGGYADFETMSEYNKDTLQLVFSSTKTLASIMIAYLVDRGLLNYDEKISTYWPEFAQGNKENVTLLDLVNHRAGVTYLDRQLTKSELEDLDKLAKILAAQPHIFDGVPLRAYHASTRGLYLNEIVRRVDPKHRTIGQIVSEEILKQYDLEFYLLLPQNHLSRVAPFYFAPITENIIRIRNFLLDWWYKKKNSDPFILESIDQKDLMLKTFNNTIPHIFEFKGVTKLERFTFECPSVTGITNAKSMAKLGAIITNNGQPLDDNSNSKPFISKNTIDLISTKLPIEWDYFIGRNLTPSVGGFAYFKFPGLEDVEFLGWGGLGGSLFVWNRELGISFGYAMNAIKMSTFGDKRGWSLLKEIVNIVNKLKKEQSESSFSKNK
ncbi:beta-lactamase/transpeptidase-like protein [Gigaspora margarita]|uniref:Beta-lactamase/transpeptidase-like protein n=1 Tax=Gigaspora margarita TaxID=4874 RepID=A0A8H3WVL7_GIGMA|nr:beta-lactamase/transpeptidase-like protein [Gigaspora margarita]